MKFARNSKVIGVSLTVLALLLGVNFAYAQTTTPQFVEYSAKFVCGTVPATIPSTMVAPGTYFTSINIHNPALLLSTTPPLIPVTFHKKAVLSIQEPQPPSSGGTTNLPAPSALVTDQLLPDYAEEVDCPIIRRLLGPVAPAGFIEGWVVIYVPPTNTTNILDVVGVYTDDHGSLVVQPAAEHRF